MGTADYGRFQGLAATESGATLTFHPVKGNCVGLLLRRPKNMGGLQIQHNGEWIDCDLVHEPGVLEEDDPDRNPIIRHFFHADKLPVAFDEIHLRTRLDKKETTVQILGFLVVENLKGVTE